MHKEKQALKTTIALEEAVAECKSSAEIPLHYSGVKIDKFIVMPNHIHAILAVTDGGMKVDISTVLGQYKMSVTKKIRIKKPEFMVWQRSYHDHVIRGKKDYLKILYKDFKRPKTFSFPLITVKFNLFLTRPVMKTEKALLFISQV